MTTARFLLLVPLTLLAGDEPKPKPTFSPAVRSLVDLARAAGPEFFAETAVRIVESGKIPQRELRVQLLEDAFQAAASAKEPIRLIAIPSTPPDTRALYRSKAAQLNLDALSLEARVLETLITEDRAKARELFEHIPRPVLDPRPCNDPLIADASAYYELAGSIAQSAFTPAEKEKDAHVQFLATLLNGARSPNELAPFARSLQTVTFTAPQWAQLLNALAEKLTAISADYRPFAISLDELQSEIHSLADMSRAGKLGVDTLPGALRKYLANQLSAARCSPDIAITQPDWIEPVNNETNPSRLDGIPTFELYFQSGESKSLGDSLLQLQKSAPAGLADFLSTYNGWRPSGSDIDVFHQRATVLRALLQMIPRGDDRDRILAMSTAMLASSGIDRDNPAEWLLQVKAIVEGAGADSVKLKTLFRSSSNAALALFAAFNP